MSKSKPADISRKQTKFETKLEIGKKKHNSYVSFDAVTFAIYCNNNGNMVVGEIPEFFQFPRRDICISTARCKCTNFSSHIKVSRSSLEPNLSAWQFYFPCRFFLMFFFTWSWIQFFFKEIFLVIRNFCITIFKIELVFRRAERRCSGSLFSMLLFKKLYLMQIFSQYLLNKKGLYMSTFGYEYICLNWIISLKV